MIASPGFSSSSDAYAVLEKIADPPTVTDLRLQVRDRRRVYRGPSGAQDLCAVEVVAGGDHVRI